MNAKKLCNTRIQSFLSTGLPSVAPCDRLGSFFFFCSFCFPWLTGLWLNKTMRNSTIDSFSNCLLALVYLVIHLHVLLLIFLSLSFHVCVSGFSEVLVQDCHQISHPRWRFFCLLSCSASCVKVPVFSELWTDTLRADCEGSLIFSLGLLLI